MFKLKKVTKLLALVTSLAIIVSVVAMPASAASVGTSKAPAASASSADALVLDSISSNIAKTMTVTTDIGTYNVGYLPITSDLTIKMNVSGGSHNPSNYRYQIIIYRMNQLGDGPDTSVYNPLPYYSTSNQLSYHCATPGFYYVVYMAKDIVTGQMIYDVYFPTSSRPYIYVH